MYRQKEKKDPAVSPVVGVMLMLVVTIIIAAVVSSFASGLGDTTEPAPVASYEFTINAGIEEMNKPDRSASGRYPFELRVLAGDSIPSKDLQIITTYTVPETSRGVGLAHAGKVIKHTLDGSIYPLTPSGREDMSTAIDKTAEGYPFTPQVSGYPDTLYPPTNNFGQSAFFGACIFEPTITYYFRHPSWVLGFDVSDKQYGFGEGSVVHITVIHTPSGKAIFDKDVIAKW